jgi:hypothetical protein
LIKEIRMAVLADYNYFLGRHWETGSVSNHYAYQGVKAPHTNQPYSEAMLMGVSGGIVMAYFSFAYEGYDPQARVLTRNTFDPLDTLLERLGVVQDRTHTPDPARAERKLLEALDSGIAPIVWADMFSLPYNNLPHAEDMWGMFPLVVFGYDLQADRAWIADRARVPLHTTATELKYSRGRVKNVQAPRCGAEGHLGLHQALHRSTAERLPEQLWAGGIPLVGRAVDQTQSAHELGAGVPRRSQAVFRAGVGLQRHHDLRQRWLCRAGPVCRFSRGSRSRTENRRAA